jgi:hypothetical protein
LRAGPQDLPWSPLLLWLTLAVHWLLGSAVFAFRLPLGQALGAGLVGTAVLVAMTVSLLYINRLQGRTVQSVTALAGADVIVGLAALPVTASLHGTSDQTGPSGITALLFLIILCWNLTVTGHVLRHSLNAPLALGIVIALIFYILSVNVLHALFPAIG